MLQKGWRDLSKFDLPVNEMTALIHEIGAHDVNHFNLKVMRYGIRKLRFRSRNDYGTLEVSFSVTRKQNRTDIRMDAWAWFGKKRIEFSVLGSAAYENPVMDSLMQNYLYSYMAIIMENDDRLRWFRPMHFPDNLLDYISGEDYEEVRRVGYRFHGEPYFPFTIEKLPLLKSKPKFLDISSS